MATTKTITLEAIEQLREKLKAAPTVSPEKRQVTKQEAIAAIRGEIEAMQKRGYTLDDIAQMIAHNGIEITTPTLKSYLQRAKSSKKTRVIKPSTKTGQEEKSVSSTDKKQ